MLRKTEVNFNVAAQGICLFDENVPHEYAKPFKKIGYQPFFVSEFIPGSPDVEVFALAQTYDALLVTRDKHDFGALVFRDGLWLQSGILVLRDPVSTIDVATLDGKRFTGWFSSFSADNFRQRKIPVTSDVVGIDGRSGRSNKRSGRIVGKSKIGFESTVSSR